MFIDIGQLTETGLGHMLYRVRRAPPAYRLRAPRAAYGVAGTGLRRLTFSRFQQLITAIAKLSSAICASEHCARSRAKASSSGSVWGMPVTSSA
nr:hypothetical protein RSP673_15610 [Ralstonia solanacearum P673]